MLRVENQGVKDVVPQIIEPPPDGEFDVKMMTYNVLADQFIDGHVRRALNSTNNRQSICTLEFGYRFEKIIDEISRSDCDIVAL